MAKTFAWAAVAHSAKAAQADSQEVLLLQQINAQAAFYDLLAAQQRLQAVQAISQSAKQLAHSAQLRLKAGDLSAQDAARIQIEAERSRAEEQSAALDRQQPDALVGLARLCAAGGRRGKAPVPVTAKASRDDRRKAALKANMARRKDQARLRAAQQRDGDTPDDNDERGE